MPGKTVCMGAQLSCTFGTAPAVLIPTNQIGLRVTGMTAATVMDHAPIVNIPTFGMCNCTANPAVASATAAAQGVHTPAPCVPATSSPWTPGSMARKAGGKPVLTETDKCMCSYGGMVSVSMPGNLFEKTNV